MIDPSFSEKQKELFESVVGFAREELNTNVHEDDEARRFPLEKWKKCGNLKLQGLCIPEAYGGAGLDAVTTAVALEALGYASEDGGLNFSIGAHLLACALPLALHGSKEQKEKYLPRLCRGELIACNAMTEPESGSNAFDMKTRAEKKDDGYSLNGTKVFLTNAPVADIFLMYALTDPEKGFYGGVSAFIIEKNKAIVCSPVKKMGLHTSPMGTINFGNMHVEKGAMLGKEGAGAMIFSESMKWERSLLSAMHVGTMRRMLEDSKERIRAAENRHSRDDLQGRHFKLADMALKTESARLLAYQAAAAIATKHDKALLYASMAKAFCSESLNEVCQMAFELACEEAQASSPGVERCLRDSAAAKIYSGTNEIQKNIIASFILK